MSIANEHNGPWYVPYLPVAIEFVGVYQCMKGEDPKFDWDRRFMTVYNSKGQTSQVYRDSDGFKSIQEFTRLEPVVPK